MNDAAPEAQAPSPASSATGSTVRPLPYNQLSQIQIAFLVIVSCVILLLAPSHFHFQPDTGIYVGGAESLLASGSYRFAGQPILIYYPGFSLLLAAPMSLFGMDFQVLHLFSALWCVAALWLIRAYYAGDTYAWAGLLTPALLPFAGIFQEQALYILSDAAFLAWSFIALLLWRRFSGSGRVGLLVLCALVVSFAPLIRMQGLFLVAAFGIALLLEQWDRNAIAKRLAIVAAISLAVAAPFLLWTLRNYLQHTPETYNVANKVFFGEGGLALYSSDFHQVDWIDTRWKYGVLNFFYTIRDLAETLFGKAPLEWVRLEAIPVVLGIPLLFGIGPWWRKATHMERAYVIISAFFISAWALRSGSLYTVPRYWLPLLPFVLLIGILGFQRIYGLMPWRAVKPWLVAAYLCLATVLVSQGAQSALTKLEPWAEHYYETSEETRLALADYVHKTTGADSVIAVTDWGVLPLSIERETFSVLNDKDRVGSLRRIVKKGATHLVILEGTSAIVKPAQEMVAELPQVFTPELEIRPKGTGAGGGVYRIDLEQAASALNLLKTR
jgi:4-amino-4-deoxy-L-arabinose transferase-like glycosyltransferase